MSVFGTPETVSIANPDPSDRMTIDGRRGEDTISGYSDAITQVIHGGDGDDALSGGPREDVLVGGDGRDQVAGFAGDDVAHLGDDADLYEWEPGTGDDVVDGGSGHDSIELAGADEPERFELSPRGRRLRLAHDLEAVDADDVEEVHVALAAGTDPDGAPDRVVVTGTEREDTIAVAGEGRSVTVAGLPALVGITRAEPLDTLAIRTAGGDDTVDRSGLPDGVIGLVVE